jgi:uridine phosphorylase
VIGQSVGDTIASPNATDWTTTVERYDFYGTDAVPSFETLASIAAANDARIQSIAMVLRAYPERIGQVEALLQIPMGS